MAETGEKYTEARRAVLAESAGLPAWVMSPLHIREAERLGHTYIGCEHLLLGILADERDAAARVLVNHGLTLGLARRRIAEIVGDGGRDSVRWQHSPRSTVVFKLAEIEAERLGQLQARHAHTLLAMITEGAGVPMSLFIELGLDLDRLREDLLDTLRPPAEVRRAYLGQRKAAEERQARQRSLAR